MQWTQKQLKDVNKTKKNQDEIFQKWGSFFQLAFSGRKNGSKQKTKVVSEPQRTDLFISVVKIVYFWVLGCQKKTKKIKKIWKLFLDWAKFSSMTIFRVKKSSKFKNKNSFGTATKIIFRIHR